METERVDPAWKVRGWALKEKLDKEKEEEEQGERTEPTLGVTWGLRAEGRPTITDSSTAEGFEDEIEWIQRSLVDLPNKHTRRITVCNRSKQWWNDDVRDKRKVLGRAKRRRRQGEDTEQVVRAAKRELRRTTRKAKRECWEEFLNRAESEDVWTVSGTRCHSGWQRPPLSGTREWSPIATRTGQRF